MSISKVCGTICDVATAAVAVVVIAGVTKGCYDYITRQMEINKQLKARKTYAKSSEETVKKANAEAIVDYHTALDRRLTKTIKMQCIAFGCILARKGIHLERAKGLDYDTIMTVLAGCDLAPEVVSYYTAFAMAIDNLAKGNYSLLTPVDFENITEIRTANTKAIHS